MQNSTGKNVSTGGSNTVLAAVKKWWHKGEGGEWYEPYVTNGDVVICCFIGIIGGFATAVACCLL